MNTEFIQVTIVHQMLHWCNIFKEFSNPDSDNYSLGISSALRRNVEQFRAYSPVIANSPGGCVRYSVKSNLSFRIFTERGHIAFHEPMDHLTSENPP